MSRAALVTAFAVIVAGQARAQPCNPVIDGTYCAEANISSNSSRSRVSISPIQSLGGDLFSPQDQPATLGAITFRGDGTQCIGLLRRGRCN